jgi:hypothetical protein
LKKAKIKHRAGVLGIKRRQLALYKSLFECLDSDGDQVVALEAMKDIVPSYNTLVKVSGNLNTHEKLVASVYINLTILFNE